MEKGGFRTPRCLGNGKKGGNHVKFSGNAKIETTQKGMGIQRTQGRAKG